MDPTDPRRIAASRRRDLRLAPHERFCDLGAGDGRIISRVRAATGATCTGIEASPLLWAVARVRLAFARDPGASVRWGDLYAADLSAFDVVYVWGTAYSVGTPRFRDMVLRTMRRGARVVSYHTEIPGLVAETRDDGGQRPIHTYVIGRGQVSTTSGSASASGRRTPRPRSSAPAGDGVAPRLPSG